MTSALSTHALQRAQHVTTSAAGISNNTGPESLRGSNIGGFQEILASDSVLAQDLRAAFTGEHNTMSASCS
jgi:hypothetical protein